MIKHANAIKEVPKAEDLKRRIYQQVRWDLQRIEAAIARHLTSSVPLIDVVGKYIMKSGGKRLRPLLMVLSARACGYRGEKDADLAAVFEFLHAATLLHDDVVDNAEIRRKVPAANTLWGNPAVVLVGDFLYSKSLLMSVAYENIRILDVLTQTTTRMAEGEVLQLIHSDDLETDEEAYMDVIIRKTAVLMTAACRIGAIFAGAPMEMDEALRRYGHHLGIAFQLTDDLLDYTGDMTELGKPVGNDIQEGKATLPLIHAYNSASAEEKRRIRDVFVADAIGPEDFGTIVDIVHRRGGIRYTWEKAKEHLFSAQEALSPIPDGTARKTLIDIAHYVLSRRS